MKKLLFLIPLILMSCSKDEAKEESIDPIIGTWKPIADVSKYESAGGIEDYDERSSCEQQTRISIKANGEITVINYEHVYEGNEIVGCEQEEASEIQYWEKATGNFYRLITMENGSEKYAEEIEFLFGNDNREMKVMYYRDEEKGEYDYSLFQRVD